MSIDEKLPTEGVSSPPSGVYEATGNDKPAGGTWLDNGTVSPTAREAGEPEAPAEERKTKSIGLITLALCMATFLAALDVAVVTTALPFIADELGASQSAYSWVGSAYLLPYSALGPFWAKCSDVFGRKPILLAANIVFFVGSIVCASADSVAMLIAGRAVQGMGGGGLVLLTTITISDLVNMRDRGKYFGYIGMVWATASAIGPIIGGSLAQNVSWRWCFYINLPCDGVAFIVLLVFLRVHNPRTPIIKGLLAIDWIGSLLVLGATLMLLLGLQYGGEVYPWDSATVICLIVFGLVAYVVFFLAEWKLARYPIIPLRLFRKASTCATLGVASAHGFSFVAGIYFLPFYFQIALGATPILSAVWLLPYALVLAAFSLFTGQLIKSTGRYVDLIIGGMAFATLGSGLFIDLPAYKSWPRIIIYQIIAAIGLGPNFQAPMIAIQTNITPADIAVGTATFGLTRNLSSAISIVIGGVIIQNRMNSHRNELLGAGIDEGLVDAIAGGAAGVSNKVLDQLTDAQRSIVSGAVAESLSKMWIFYTCILFLGFLAALGIGSVELSKKHEEHKTGLAVEEANRLANAEKAADEEKAAPAAE